MRLSPFGLAVALALCAFVAPFGYGQEAGGGPAAEDREVVAEADALRAELLRQADEALALRERIERAEGDYRLILQRRLIRRQNRFLADLKTLTDNILAQEEQGLDTASLREQVEPWMFDVATRIEELTDEARRILIEHAAEFDKLSVDEQIDHQLTIDRDSQRVTDLFEVGVDHVEQMDVLGLDAGDFERHLDEMLIDWAALISEDLDLLLERREALTARLREDPTHSGFQSRILLVDEKREGAVAGLRAVAGLLEQRDIDSSEYERQLLQTTGEISTNIFQRRVISSLFAQWTATVRDWIGASGPGMLVKLLLFLAILFAARLLARVAENAIQRVVRQPRFQLSQLLQRLIVNSISNAVMLVGLLVGLSQIGVNLGPLLAGFGIAGFIVGFALQDTLANFAAGLMILFYRPFDVGDIVDAGTVFGKVSSMSMVSTTVMTFDNQTLIVPNNKIWGDVIKNVTAQTQRRVDLEFGISYEADIPRAESVLQEILANHPKVLDDPESQIRVHRLGESSVDFIVRPWVETDDYWDVYWDVTREVKIRFDKEGIGIPFPQRDVHLYQKTADQQ